MTANTDTNGSRNPKIVPVAGEVFTVPGGGPIGNPLLVRVERVDESVHFATAMGGGSCALADWPDYVNYPDVTVNGATA